MLNPGIQTNFIWWTFKTLTYDRNYTNCEPWLDYNAETHQCHVYASNTVVKSHANCCRCSAS